MYLVDIGTGRKSNWIQCIYICITKFSQSNGPILKLEIRKVLLPTLLTALIDPPVLFVLSVCYSSDRLGPNPKYSMLFGHLMHVICVHGNRAILFLSIWQLASKFSSTTLKRVETGLLVNAYICICKYKCRFKCLYIFLQRTQSTHTAGLKMHLHNSNIF